MTPDRFRECLDLLCWTQRGLAKILGNSEGTVRRWARGSSPIPNSVATWINERAEHAESTPAPKGFFGMKKYIIVLDERMPCGERKMMQVHADSLQAALKEIGETEFSSPVLGMFTPEGKAGAFALARAVD